MILTTQEIDSKTAKGAKGDREGELAKVRECADANHLHLRRESIYYESHRDNYIPTTAENTSLSSANSSLKSTASNEQSSSESLTERRRMELARHRAKLQKQRLQSRIR